MNYELAKKLKDAGFPYREDKYPMYLSVPEHKKPIRLPTLSELIAACGDAQKGSGFLFLSHNATTPRERWFAEGRLVNEGRITNKSALGETPEEAVANLWLALQKTP